MESNDFYLNINIPCKYNCNGYEESEINSFLCSGKSLHKSVSSEQ